MTARTAQKISADIDTIPEEKLTAWNVLVKTNDVVSKYKGVETLMHMNFVNGSMVRAMCVMTDWKPGLLVLQSEDGALPYLRAVDPEETAEFMEKIESLFNTQY